MTIILYFSHIDRLLSATVTPVYIDMSGSDSKAAAAAAVTTDIEMMARRCVTPIPQRIGFIGSGKMAMAIAQ